MVVVVVVAVVVAAVAGSDRARGRRPYFERAIFGGIVSEMKDVSPAGCLPVRRAAASR